jgi:transglutaminase-like putative cysteine protease
MILNKKRGVILTGVFLVFVSFVFAIDDSLFYSDNLNLNVKISSNIELIRTGTYSSVDYVAANLSFFPENTYRQEIKTLAAKPDAKSTENSILFLWNSPTENQLTLEVDTDIKNYNKFKEVKSKIKFPLSKLDEDVAIYTKSTEKIDINQEIINKATEIAEGEDDLYVVVTKLGIWVNKNIKYDLNTLTAEASQKSSWVLENKEGVCDELTNLFISMNRALGIPARFVSGISYSNSETFETPWGPHGWAEVYFPSYGWVPFDVTYGEYGYLDATHIQCREGIDSEKSTIEYEWKSKNVNLNTGKLDIVVDVIRKSGKANYNFEINPDVFSDKINFGSYNLVKAELINEKSNYYTTTLTLIRPVEVEIVDDLQKTVVVAPGEKKKVFWIVKIPKNLDKKNIYTFPLLIIDSLNNSYQTSFSSDFGEIDYSYQDIMDIYNLESQYSKNYETSIEMNCSSMDIYVNETAMINCYVKNKGNSNLKGLSVCLDKECKITDLLISQTYTNNFSKTFSTIGKKKVEYKVYSNQIQQTLIIDLFVNDKPSITVSNLKYPSAVEFDEKFKVSFILEKSSHSEPKNISMSLKGGNVVEKWKLENLDGENEYEINLQGAFLNEGENQFKITLNYKDEKGNSYKKEEDFEMELTKVTVTQKIMIFFSRVSAYITGLFNKSV